MDVQRRPLGHPAPAPAGDGGYAFLSRLPGIASGPVTYDPYRPIHLVVNHRYAPAGADRLLDEATREVSRATGLVFGLEGPTDEQPDAGRPLRDGGRYGNRWSPVLVAWTSPDVVPGLKGDVAGLAGSVTYQPAGVGNGSRYVTGSVSLDGPAFTAILARPDGWGQARAIVMH